MKDGWVWFMVVSFFFYGGMMWGWERVLVDLGLGRCICVLVVFED